MNEKEKNITEAATRAYASISASVSSVSFPAAGGSKTVSVTCSDTSWTTGGGNDWCTITKTSNTSVRITVTANTGNSRATGVVCVNGSNVATISVNQAAPSATYNRYSKITVYQQITTTSCATTCAAMCVNRSPETLQDDGFNLGWADWSGIARKYDYTTSGVYSISSLTEVLNVLIEGYPVIAQVNDGTNGSSEHWAVIYKFSGNPSAPVASNFTCADPWTGDTRTLNNAINYSSVKRIVVFRN